MLSRINKELVPMKAHYFLWNAGTAPVVPFLSTYARQLGFSASVVGLIYTILPICGMLAKPLMGAVADRFKCQKLIFLVSQLVLAATFLAIFYSPDIPPEREVHLSCAGSLVFDTSPNPLTTENNCLIDQLQNSEGSVNCDLDCTMEEKFWDVIANYWHVGQYQTSHPDRLKFTGAVNRNKTILINHIFYFAVGDVTIDSEIYTPSCPGGQENHISTLCSVTCDDFSLNNIMEKPSVSDEEVYHKSEFWIFLVLMIISWVNQAINVSVGDAICFEMLGDKPHRYGHQRMYGALGWGIFSIITGLMVDALSKGSGNTSLVSAFYLAAAFLVVDFIVSTQIKFTQKKVSSNILKDVGRLLVDIRIIVFLITCILIGMCTALMWQFLFFLIEDLAHKQGCNSENWIKTLEGIIMSVQTLAGELPLFFWSGKIIKRIGHTNSLSLVLLVIGIRFILYSVIPNPWYFLPIELLNGLTFGLFYACMASYASIVAPPGTEATMQGMVGAVFEGVGVSLGSFVGGQLYDVYQGPHTFRIYGIGALIACLLHAGVQYILKRQDGEAKYSAPRDALRTLEEDQQELALVGY